jgi:hypothetical protein
MIVGVPTGCGSTDARPTWEGFTGPCVRTGTTCAVIMRYPGLMRVMVDFSLCPTSYRRDTTMRGALLVQTFPSPREERPPDV